MLVCILTKSLRDFRKGEALNPFTESQNLSLYFLQVIGAGWIE